MIRYFIALAFILTVSYGTADAVTCYALRGTLTETQTPCGLKFCTKGIIRNTAGVVVGSYNFTSDSSTMPPGIVKVATGKSTVSLLKGFFGLTQFSTFQQTDIAIIDTGSPTRDGLKNDWNFSAQSRVIPGTGTGNFVGIYGLQFYQGRAKFTPLAGNSTFNSNFTGKVCRP